MISEFSLKRKANLGTGETHGVSTFMPKDIACTDKEGKLKMPSKNKATSQLASLSATDISMQRFYHLKDTFVIINKVYA